MFQSQDSQHLIRRLAVVGSGMAGLTAAHQLAGAGVDVTLFEKGRGPGGRMASRRLPGPGAGAVDLGAQYFTVRNPDFRAFLDRHAGPSRWGQWRGRMRYQDVDHVWQEMRPADRYVGIPRMSAITRALSGGLNVSTGVRIERMGRDPTGLWQLIDSRGQVHGRYDAVLLTPPPAQSVDLLNHSGLPGLAADLDLKNSPMQACWAVAVHFPRGTGAGFDGMMPNSPRLHWAANNTSKPGRGKDGEWWVLHGDPDWSDAHTAMDPAQVTREFIGEFLQVSGIGSEVGETLVHRWLYARPRAKTGPGHLWFAAERIAVAGDWLDGGRVEGAFNSADGLTRRLAALGLLPGNLPVT